MKEVLTMVGMPAGTKNARLCKSKWYPHDLPEYPEEELLSSQSAMNPALSSQRCSPVARCKLTYEDRNRPMPFGLIPLGIRNSGLRFTWHFLKNWIQAILGYFPGSGTILSKRERIPSYGS